MTGRPGWRNAGTRLDGFTAEEFARSRVSFHQTMIRRFEHRLATQWRDDSGCRVWTGRLGTNGYGLLVVPGTSRAIYVHRYIWEQANGPIPTGLELLHSCDRPPLREVGSPSFGVASRQRARYGR